jgi:hypothetical protein
LLNVAATVFTVTAVFVAVLADNWDRASRALDTSGDSGGEAGAIVVVSAVWVLLAVAMLVLGIRIREGSEAPAAVIAVIGSVLVVGNLCEAGIVPNGYPHDLRAQQVVDQYVPHWYQVVPPWAPVGLAALMTVVGLVLLALPASRLYLMPRHPLSSRAE